MNSVHRRKLVEQKSCEHLVRSEQVMLVKLLRKIVLAHVKRGGHATANLLIDISKLN